MFILLFYFIYKVFLTTFLVYKFISSYLNKCLNNFNLLKFIFKVRIWLAHTLNAS